MLESIFEQCAVASGLVTESELISAWKEMRDSDLPLPEEVPDRLAEILLRRSILNSWQVKQLLKGQKRFTLGKYKMFDSIGRGGMGEVYKARHMETQQIAAVKVLPSKKATESAVKNFENEIRFMSRLSHPNLVAAIEAGFDGNVNYLVTEYVPGPDLRKLVRNRGPLSQKSAASIIIQAARGLQHAHSMGFVHRDVKPGNILVTMNGMAKLSDLGLASHREFTDDSEKKSKIVGTADYIAPDQVRAPASPDPICDIYSLGCTLYFIVTGKPPYPGGSASEKVKKHLSETEYPTNPALLNPLLTEEFTDVMACMMAKDPEERIASAQDVIHFLSQWSDGTPRPLEFVSSECASMSGIYFHWEHSEPAHRTKVPSVLPTAETVQTHVSPENHAGEHAEAGELAETAVPPTQPVSKNVSEAPGSVNFVPEENGQTQTDPAEMNSREPAGEEMFEDVPDFDEMPIEEIFSNEISFTEKGAAAETRLSQTSENSHPSETPENKTEINAAASSLSEAAQIPQETSETPTQIQDTASDRPSQGTSGPKFSIPLPPPVPSGFASESQFHPELNFGVSSLPPIPPTPSNPPVPPSSRSSASSSNGSNASEENEAVSAETSAEESAADIQGRKLGKLGNLFKRFVQPPRSGSRSSGRSSSRNSGKAPDLTFHFPDLEANSESNSEE